MLQTALLASKLRMVGIKTIVPPFALLRRQINDKLRLLL